MAKMTLEELRAEIEQALSKIDGIADVEILEDGSLAVACISGEEYFVEIQTA